MRYELENLNGYANNFAIYDTSDSKNLIKQVLKEMNLDETPARNEQGCAGKRVLIFCGIAFTATLAGWFDKLTEAPVILGIIAGIAVLVIRYYMRKAQAENIVKIKRTNHYTDAQIEKLIDLAERGTKETED